MLSKMIIVAILAVASSALASGPREPLTAQNVGQYGPWCEYLTSKDLPFDFLIVQAIVFEDHIEWNGWTKEDKTSWNEYLKRARANGKRVIADVHPALYTEDGELQTLNDSYRSKKPVPVERFLPLIDKFFREVDEEELYAITISEEHTAESGQPERLNAVYDYIKQHHKIDAYQWYTPSKEGSVPGLNYPNLESDGWMADEYWVEQPRMEEAMRAFVVQQKPMFQIIWASPDCAVAPWSEKTFWEQFKICRKYNIPVAFFCYSDRMEGPQGNKWSWDSRSSQKMKDVLQDYCVYTAMLAKRLPKVSLEEWDFVPWGRNQIVLKQDKANPGKASYHETFSKLKDVSVWRDADITGFANLRWDSSPVQLRPRTIGDAEATLSYTFVNSRKINRINVRVDGATPRGKVDLQLRDFWGKPLAQTTLDAGAAVIALDVSNLGDQRFVVVCRLKGTSTQVGEVLAEISEISVVAELQ